MIVVVLFDGKIIILVMLGMDLLLKFKITNCLIL
jgi:hypothetical protein